MFCKLAAAIERRSGLNIAGLWGAFATNFNRKAPPHAGWSFTLGWAIGAVFMALCLSGFLLLFYYRPTPKEAYNSVAYITDNVHLGWLVLQVHRWGTHLIVALFLLFIARDFWLAAYKFPRDWAWCFSILLFGTVLGFGFVGRILPWDQHAFHATTIATEIIRQGGGPPGAWLCKLLRGGELVSGETLTRFYVLHILFFPGAFIGCFVLRWLFARPHGISPKTSVDEEQEKGYEAVTSEGRPAFPRLFSKQWVAVIVVLLILLTGSILGPIPIGEKADPISVPDLLKPEWYFLPLHQLTKYYDVWICVVISVLVSALVLTLPFIDRSPNRQPGKRKKWMAAAGVFLFITLLLGVLGHLSGRERTYFGTKVKFTMTGVPVKMTDDSQDTRGPR